MDSPRFRLDCSPNGEIFLEIRTGGRYRTTDTKLLRFPDRVECHVFQVILSGGNSPSQAKRDSCKNGMSGTLKGMETFIDIAGESAALRFCGA